MSVLALSVVPPQTVEVLGASFRGRGLIEDPGPVYEPGGFRELEIGLGFTVDAACLGALGSLASDNPRLRKVTLFAARGPKGEPTTWERLAETDVPGTTGVRRTSNGIAIFFYGATFRLPATPLPRSCRYQLAAVYEHNGLRFAISSGTLELGAQLAGRLAS